MPKIIAHKEKSLINSIKLKVLNDIEAYKKYDETINDIGRPSFTDKLGALKELNKEFNQQDEKSRIL